MAVFPVCFRMFSDTRWETHLQGEVPFKDRLPGTLVTTVKDRPIRNPMENPGAGGEVRMLGGSNGSDRNDR